jgi:AmpD protein
MTVHSVGLLPGVCNGWLQGVRQLASPNYNPRPADAVINLLVIHNISLPPGQYGGDFVDALFCNTLDCDAHPFFDQLRNLHVSAHFFISRQGVVTQYVPVSGRAWHAGVSHWQGRDNCNDFSIGIELEGTDTDPYTDAQYDTLAALTQQLQQICPAICVEQIVGHCDIAPGRKSDPGAVFDWQRFRKSLAQPV